MTLAEEVAQYHWFHTIDLGQGVLTPGGKSAAQWIKRLAHYLMVWI
jgi:hypothetical protein